MIGQESVEYDKEGLEALIFTAEGDMRYALNNLQATVSGFDKVTKDNVFKVCDQPHPDLIKRVIDFCLAREFENAASEIDIIYNEGYNIMDIVGTLSKLIQNYNDKAMDEVKRLVYLRHVTEFKMNILDGIDSHLQLHAFLVNLCTS